MINQQPVIQQGWMRVVLFIICYLLLIIFSNFALSSLPAQVLTPITDQMPFFYISILFNFLISLLLVWFFRKAFDRKPFMSIGLQWNGYKRERLIGFLTGVLLCFGIATVLWLMQLLHWFTNEIDIAAMLGAVLLLVIVSMAEEIVFRGYILNNLMDSLSKEAALISSAILFAVFHSLNPNFNLTAFVNILLAGILLGINFIFTRNLWFALFFHFSWNFLQGPVLDFPVSGLELPTLLQQDLKGSVLLTGGAFGLEASWLTTIFFGLAIVILYPSFQRKYEASHRS